jgi:hypothetical protein
LSEEKCSQSLISVADASQEQLLNKATLKPNWFQGLQKQNEQKKLPPKSTKATFIQVDMTADCFFSNPLPTRIIYPDKNFKVNKFSELLHPTKEYKETSEMY